MTVASQARTFCPELRVGGFPLGLAQVRARDGEPRPQKHPGPAARAGFQSLPVPAEARPGQTPPSEVCAQRLLPPERAGRRSLWLLSALWRRGLDSSWNLLESTSLAGEPHSLPLPRADLTE